MDLSSTVLLIIVLVLPSSIGIFLLHWFLTKNGKQKLANRWRKHLFILLGLTFICANVFWWYMFHHTVKLTLKDRYQLEVVMHELDSFLDWPIDFKVEVLDLKENTSHSFEFTSEGPYYQFLLSNENIN